MRKCATKIIVLRHFVYHLTGSVYCIQKRLRIQVLTRQVQVPTIRKYFAREPSWCPESHGRELWERSVRAAKGGEHRR